MELVGQLTVPGGGRQCRRELDRGQQSSMEEDDAGGNSIEGTRAQWRKSSVKADWHTLVMADEAQGGQKRTWGPYKVRDQAKLD